MARSTARAAAMQLIFENVLGGDGGDESLALVFENLVKASEKEPSGKEKSYISETLKGVLTHLDTIDEMIESHADNWRINRMAKVDLTILRLAVYEIQYTPDVPASVVINEAVELANKYSDPNGSRFINGVLGAIERSK